MAVMQTSPRPSSIGEVRIRHATLQIIASHSLTSRAQWLAGFNFEDHALVLCAAKTYQTEAVALSDSGPSDHQQSPRHCWRPHPPLLHPPPSHCHWVCCCFPHSHSACRKQHHCLLLLSQQPAACWLLPWWHAQPW